MAINFHTSRRIANQAGKPYYTKYGNTYFGIKVYDEAGRLHGVVVYAKYNNVEHEKPDYVCFVPKNDSIKDK